MFKVGDTVRVVDDWRHYSIKKGEIYTVLEVNDYGDIKNYGDIRINCKNETYFYDKNLFTKHIFTKSDLKDNHLIIYEDGSKRLWGLHINKDNYKEDLTHKRIEKYSIKEVYEFDKLVWKREEQILDEIEKKYLSGVIRPFRDRIDGIKKEKHIYGEKIKIYYDIKLNEINYMSLPYFEKGTMYKNMEIDKKYSIKELGL